MNHIFRKRTLKNATMQLASEADRLGVPPSRQAKLLRLFRQSFRTRSIGPHVALTTSPLFIAFRLFLLRDDLPSLSLARFACRMIHQYSARVQCDRVLHIIATSKTMLADLRKLKVEFLGAKSRRQRNAIKSPAYREAVRQFLAHVNYPHAVPFIEFKKTDDENNSFSASTDGKRILLPHQIEVDDGSENSEINVLILMFLCFHEMQHFGVFGARGTFDFSFETPQGAILLERLRSRATTFRHNLANWDGATVFRKVLEQEGIEADQEQPALSHLQAFTFFHSNPQLVHWIMNLFEDLRLDAQARLCGMGELQEITNRMSSRGFRHHCRYTSQELFSMHLVAAVRDPDLKMPKPTEYNKIITEILDIIEEFKSLPFAEMSPETSATFTCRVYEVLEGVPNGESIINESATPRTDVSLTEIMIRRQVMGMSNARNGDSSQGGEHLRRKPDKFVPGKRQVDEFDYDEVELKKDAVTIREKVFKPWRTALPQYRLAQFRPWQPLSKAMRLSSRNSGSILSHIGSEMSIEMASSFLAEAATGRKPRQGLFLDKGNFSSRAHISIAIDLSVSMEQRKPNLPALPMQMVIDSVSRIAEACQRFKINLDVWGVHDGGRQPVKMYQIDRGDLGNIHAIALGGARLGAAVRYLNGRFNPNSIDRHVIILMTDGAPAYVQTGSDDLFESVKQNCRLCQLRAYGHKGCHVETDLRMSTDKHAWGLHLSAQYQYADVAHAIESSPRSTTVRYIEFIDKPYDGLLNNFLGDNWLSCNGELDLSGIFR